MQLNGPLTGPLYAIRERDWIGNMRGRTFPHRYDGGRYHAVVPEGEAGPEAYVLVDAVKAVRARGVRFEPSEPGRRAVVFAPEGRT